MTLMKICRSAKVRALQAARAPAHDVSNAPEQRTMALVRGLQTHMLTDINSNRTETRLAKSTIKKSKKKSTPAKRKIKGRKSPRVAARATSELAKSRAKHKKKNKDSSPASWAPTPEAQTVIDTTQDVFDNVSGAAGDCNKFVKEVCAKLATNPFTAGDDADKITKCIRDAKWLKANGWTSLKQDPVEAKTAADRGDLVVGGATSTDLSKPNGHVVIVVSCEALWKGYGYASWGTLGGKGRVNAKMTETYKLADLPKVSYMYKAV